MPPKNLPVPQKLKFAEGEKVLCFHGPLIYEAKCLKANTTKDKQIKYLVHYAGWSKNWDEWVPESRVLKYNEVNVAKQKEVQKIHAAQAKAAKKNKSKTKNELNTTKDSDSRANTPLPDTPTTTSSTTDRKSMKTKLPSTPSSSSNELVQTPEPSKKKRGKLENTVEPDEEFVSKGDINIKIPDELKQLLVDDWDIIMKQKKLWPIPATLTVDEILNNYINYKKINKTDTDIDISESPVTEITKGIREYFNAVLSTQLLYKFERPQFAAAIEDVDNVEEDILPSSIYGSMHLLRLFVRLGGNLAFTALDDQNIQFFVEHIHDFLKYLSKNAGMIFNLQECFIPNQDNSKKAV